VRVSLLVLVLTTLAACARDRVDLPADPQPASADPTPVEAESSTASPPAEAPVHALSETPAPTLPSYDQVLADLAGVRGEFAAQYTAAETAEARTEVLASARQTVFETTVEQIFPHWYGTPWDYYGTTETPGEGLIACGYFVSTVLRDAGFLVERVTLAQQPSELIVKTFATEDDIWRYRGRAGPVVAEQVRSHGDGLYVVGLDIHVGFLVVRDESVDFCDASFLEDAAVICQPASQSPSFASNYRVVGKLLSDRMMEAWLAGQPIRTHPHGDLGR